MKAIRACDANLDKVTWPMWGLFKLDGVRALTVNDKLIGRSGKAFANKVNSAFFSNPLFNGFDGEMIAGGVTDRGVCNATTSALTTIEGTVETRFHLFDYVVPGYNENAPYYARYEQLHARLNIIKATYPMLRERLDIVPYTIIANATQALAMEKEAVAQGYEGLILRDPQGPYKFGRCTEKEANYLRLKGFMDAEIVVTGIVEGQHNENEKKQMPNGYSERATIAENMVPNGKVGTIVGTAWEDVYFGKGLIIKKDQLIEISPGKMPHAEREYYLQNPDAIIGQLAKYKFFPIGMKEKPRFPTFQCLRSRVDM